MKIVLRNLTKKFPGRGKKSQGDVVAVNDFTCEIPDGELIGLLGPSGCGKSTTFAKSDLRSGKADPGQDFFW